jgi:hypothetical protein
MIGEHDRLLLIGQIDPQIALSVGTNSRNRATLALRRLSPRDKPLP